MRHTHWCYHEDLQMRGVDRYVPDKGWGYSVVALNGMYEVCPFFDGDIPMDMDVLMCTDLVEVGNAITTIMAGKAPRFGKAQTQDGEEE